jgi:hypothetical protein
MPRKKWVSLTSNLAILLGLMAIATLIIGVKIQVSQAFEYSAIVLAFASLIISKKLPHKKK